MNIESSLSVSLKVGTFNKTHNMIVNAEIPKLHSTDSLVTARKKSKGWKLLEIVGISIVVLIIIGLTSLPVVFFYLPRVRLLCVIFDWLFELRSMCSYPCFCYYILFGFKN